MSFAKAKNIIQEQIEALDDEYEAVEIQFMGGEPLLEFPLIKECAKWLWSTPITDKQIMLFAPTNGTLLTDDMNEWFAKNKDRIHLGLSFDGDTKTPRSTMRVEEFCSRRSQKISVPTVNSISNDKHNTQQRSEHGTKTEVEHP